MRGRTAKALGFVLTPVFMLGVGAFTYTTFEDFAAEPEENSPYKFVSSESSPGMIWLDRIVESQPFTHESGGDPNKWAVTNATRTLLPNDNVNCVAPQPMPPYLLNTKAGTNGSVTINAAITQPGLAKNIINDYESRASECGIKFQRVNNDEISIGNNNTTILFYGDTIVSVSIVNSGKMSTSDYTALIDDVRTNIINSLRESNCTSVETYVNDKSRNIFYTVNNEPTGLFTNEDVMTTVNTSNLPSMIDIDMGVLNYPNLTKPEGPFPVNFPDVPPKIIQPTIPGLPELKNDTYMKNVTYEIPDNIGPGCGWEWSLNQKIPQYDMASMEAEEENIKTEALTEVNASASEYVNTYLTVLADRVMKQSDIVKWNRYVDNVNNTHNRWIKLEDDRESLKPNYDEYVRLHNLWSTFDARKGISEETNRKIVEYCEQREKMHTEWLERDEDIRTFEPERCGNIPTPSILTSTKGQEPIVNIPGDVTIPDSWRKIGQGAESLISQERTNSDKSYQDFASSFVQQDKESLEKWEEEQKEKEEATRTTTPTTTPSPTTTPNTEPQNPIDSIIDLLP